MLIFILFYANLFQKTCLDKPNQNVKLPKNSDFEEKNPFRVEIHENCF